jgi:hypothetical protein
MGDAYGVGFTMLIGKGGGGILVLGFAPSGSFLTSDSGFGVALLSRISLGVVSFAESGEVAAELEAGMEALSDGVGSSADIAYLVYMGGRQVDGCQSGSGDNEELASVYSST